MLRLLKLIFGAFVRSFRARRDLLLENLALRQQLAVLGRRHPQPRFSNGDRFLLITASRRVALNRGKLFATSQSSTQTESESRDCVESPSQIRQIHSYGDRIKGGGSHL